MTQREWSESEIAMLRALRAEGKSASEIAAALNASFGEEPGYARSRNAVIGKISRLGLPMLRNPARARLYAKAAPQPIEPRKRAERRALAQAAPSLNLTLIDMPGSGACRFATTPHEDENHRFCGHPTLRGRPWCAAHDRMVWRRAKRPTVNLFAGLSPDLARAAAQGYAPAPPQAYTPVYAQETAPAAEPAAQARAARRQVAATCLRLRLERQFSAAA